MKITLHEQVRMCMVKNKNSFLKITDIAKLSGLDWFQVQRIIKCAFKLGWVKRKEMIHSKGSFGKDNFNTKKTMYQIVNEDCWLGLYTQYSRVLKNEKRRN